VASAEGIRVLALKGPVLAHHGLRPARVSSDADVLVDPDRQEALRLVLEARGWQIRFEREMPHLLERHSVTLLHPGWPVDIDLHWYFPGFHGEPGEVFGVLWEHRVQVELAHRQVTCLDLPASALVAALHCARYPHSRVRQRELHHVRERLRSAPPGTIGEVAELARLTRSSTVLADFLTDLGVAPTGTDLSPEELSRWRRYTETHELGSTGAWLSALSSGRLVDRLRMIGRAVWPSAAELQRMHPDLGPLDAGRRWRLRLVRLGRWASAVRPAWRSLREHRH
jgi:hypothetical protein